jgi:hypothetical protein
MPVVQQRQRAQQAFAYIRRYGRRGLAPANDLGLSQIDSGNLGKSTAEIDEDGERTQCKSKGKSKKAKIYDRNLTFLLFPFTFLHFAEAIMR